MLMPIKTEAKARLCAPVFKCPQGIQLQSTALMWMKCAFINCLTIKRACRCCGKGATTRQGAARATTTAVLIMPGGSGLNLPPSAAYADWTIFTDLMGLARACFVLGAALAAGWKP